MREKIDGRGKDPRFTREHMKAVVDLLFDSFETKRDGRILNLALSFVKASERIVGPVPDSSQTSGHPGMGGTSKVGG